MKGYRLMRACFLSCFVIGIFILLNNNHALAADFCVETADELNIALATAASNGQDDVIKIVQETYNGNFIYSTSTEAFRVTIEGGYTSECASRVVDATNTVLDGGENGSVLALSAPDVAADFVVDGLTIQNGNVTGSGGGLFIKSAGGNINITRNLIINNSTNSGYDGGGVYIVGPMVVNLYANTISGNVAGGNNYDNGYGMYIEHVNSVTMNDNIITNNRGTLAGGGSGVYFHDLDVLRVNNNFISNNVGFLGSGIHINTVDTVTLTNNVITKNLGARDGGGIYFFSAATVFMTNNTIGYNSAGYGGGIYLVLRDDAHKADIFNNILFSNIASLGTDIYINNDWNDNRIYSTVNLIHNDFDQRESGFFITEPGFLIDPSNLNNADPLFIDSANDDYHLTFGSQCIDAGNNSAPELSDLDKDGNPRVMNAIVDIGAYEYPGAALPIIDSFVAFPTSGEAPLAVTLTCVAHDFGGSIQTYTLDYGDGNSQSNTNGIFNYEYVTTGTFDATCTATDNDGESATSDPVTITVTPHTNIPPVADCGQEKAVVFNEITFDGTGSADPDGSVVSYEWTLQHEDGTIITASGPNPTISNLILGFYDVTLKVYDNESAFGTDTMLLAAAGSCSCTPSSIHVESITPTTIKGSKGRKFGQVTVFVADDCGNPVSSVEVTGSFSGDFNETVSGVTGADGSVTFTTSSKVKKPTYTFCVSSLANALPYESDDNVETCDELN